MILTRLINRWFVAMMLVLGVGGVAVAWMRLHVDRGLIVDRNLHEFNPTDRDLKTTFRLTNGSPSPIEITSIGASCKCTSVTVGTKSLTPGQSTELTVRMTKPSIGQAESTVSVKSNIGNQDPVKIRVIARAISNEPRIVTVAPDSIRLMSDKCPERAVHVVTFESAENDNRTLQMTCDMDGVSSEKVSEKSTPLPDPKFKRVEYTYRVCMQPDKKNPVGIGAFLLSFEDPARRLSKSRSIPIEVFR